MSSTRKSVRSIKWYVWFYSNFYAILPLFASPFHCAATFSYDYVGCYAELPEFLISIKVWMRLKLCRFADKGMGIGATEHGHCNSIYMCLRALSFAHQLHGNALHFSRIDWMKNRPLDKSLARENSHHEKCGSTMASKHTTPRNNTIRPEPFEALSLPLAFDSLVSISNSGSSKSISLACESEHLVSVNIGRNWLWIYTMNLQYMRIF